MDFLRQLWLFGFMVFNWCVVFFAAVLLVSALIPVHAQTEWKDLDRRLNAIEKIDISGQLAGIRQELADMHKQEEQREADWKPIATAIAAGLLVIERAYKNVSGKIREGDE